MVLLSKCAGFRLVFWDNMVLKAPVPVKLTLGNVSCTLDSSASAGAWLGCSPDAGSRCCADPWLERRVPRDAHRLHEHADAARPAAPGRGDFRVHAAERRLRPRAAPCGLSAHAGSGAWGGNAARTHWLAPVEYPARRGFVEPFKSSGFSTRSSSIVQLSSPRRCDEGLSGFGFVRSQQ